MTTSKLVTRLLPVMQRSLDGGFNVFDVMHHGTHEKQLSNVFRWLLEIGGSHNFKGLGQQLFLELIDRSRPGEPPLPPGPYVVRQEVNTANEGGGDIADIVLESDSAVIVVENYETSDGHGHSYTGYLNYSRRKGTVGVVVLLCEREDSALQTRKWEEASVVTYERLLERLVTELDRDPAYAKQNVEQYSFIKQMHRKYARGINRMSDTDVLDFVAAMCATGEAKRYQEQNQEVAAERFASDLAQQARESLGEGREVLRSLKGRLLRHARDVVGEQLNTSLGTQYVRTATAGYQGIYQWTINFDTGEAPSSFGEARLQIKFGPSAWYANERDFSWKRTVPPEAADYSRLFITNAKSHEVRQSAVSLHEVLNGLARDDTRLRDEILALLESSKPALLSPDAQPADLDAEHFRADEGTHA